AQAVHDEHHLPDGTVRPAGDILATRAALAAEHARADGPDYLFYPAAAADLVERQRHAARQLASSARRGHRLLGTIERMLRQRGLPADLRFVAVIESALNPSAESWAGAQGIWQFMPQTAADMGLDSLSVRDPVASTAAAARYLRWLGHEFDGDWQLALAAYNYGIGRVARLVREYEEAEGVTPTFWDLHDRLPRETQEYVPRFIAVAEVLGARGEA
ncbi:MAG: lytic transglycosylase domain-containing protein, partial [Bacteroidota bacterium]